MTERALGTAAGGWVIHSLLGLLLVLPGLAFGQSLPLWKVDGSSNTVYLLGSIHLLRAPDYPLPDRIYEAYEDADRLVMELDLDDIDPMRIQTLVARLGSLPAGRSLEAVLGEEHYARAAELAAAAGLDIGAFAGAKPWLTAITVEQIVLQQLGFDPALGIEQHFLGRAANDNKPVAGLETIEQQLGFLDGLSAEAQRELLLQTLETAPNLGPAMDDLLGAWRRGDAAFLEANLLEDMRNYPEIHEAVVVQRNRQWVEDILGRLDDGIDYLIIVGTLHLVGEEGLPALLTRNGESVEQLAR